MVWITGFFKYWSNFLWGPGMIITLVGIGIYFSIGTSFLQVRKFPYMIRETLGKIFHKSGDGFEGTVTAFQAAASALASTIGVGAIVGVSTALVFGGPGSIFWMWVSAFFGMMTKYAEILLSIEFREKNSKAEYVGGPSYYMKKGLGSKALSYIFCVAMAFMCLSGNMVQSNSIAENALEYFSIPPVFTGLVLIVFVALVSLGGIKSISRAAEKIVPFMAIFYVFGGLLVILFNIERLPMAVSAIFKAAFSSQSVLGGVSGYGISQAIKFGIVRGLYSNEAGQGTAPMAHSTAITDHPCRQGLWGIFEVFMVTMVICTMTALTVLVSGVYTSDANPAILTSMAYASVHPFFQYVVSISLVLFAYTTLLGYSYYGQTVTSMINEKLGFVFKFFFLPFSFLGSIMKLEVVWAAVDVFMGILVIPNLLALVLLSPIVFRRTREFFKEERLPYNKMILQKKD